MRLSVLAMSFCLSLLSAPVALAAVVVLDASDDPAFESVELIDARTGPGRSDLLLDTFSLAGLAMDRGQVVLDHQRPLRLEFREPVSGIAFRVRDPRHQAMLALTLFRGEHTVGAQVFAHREIPGSRVALIQDGRIAVASAQDFDRIEMRRIDPVQDAAPLKIESLALPRSSDALNELLASRGTVESLACMLPLTAVYVPAFFASLSTLFGPAAGRVAFVSNLALKFCKPSLTAPADIMVAPPSGECEVEFEQPRMAATFQTALAFTFNSGGGWGELGSPTKFHFNTDVDVMLLAGNPGPPTARFTDLEFFLSSASFDASDKIWESCRDDGSVRYSQFEGSGPQYECPYVENRTLAFPVGRTTVAWRANPRVSPVDLLDVFIPGIPPGAKNQPLRSMIYNLWIQLWLDVLDGNVDGWRLPHAQFDYQTITIIDEVPPTITPLPGSEGFATAVLVGDVLHVTIQADEIGGVSPRRYENILRSFLQADDACNRLTTLEISYPTEALRSFWPITTTTQDNSFFATWTARDPGPNAQGVPNETTTTMRIEVVDLQPPTIIPPPDIVEIDSAQVTNLGQPAVFDLVDINPQVSHDANLPLGLGLHEVTWTATDAAGNSASGIQIVNIKASNIPPVALAQTGPDRQQAVSFEPTPIRLHGHDPDGDPLRFKIEDRPENGFFVAPLYPYFIEDFRVERSVSNDELLAMCVAGGWSNFQLDFPSQPEFLTVTDDGLTYLVDKGRITCVQQQNRASRDPRLAIFDNNGNLLNSAALGDEILRDVVYDRVRERLFLTSRNGTGESTLRVYNLDLERLVVYNLRNLRKRSDGTACDTLPQPGGGCTISWANSAVVDDNDLIYVMNHQSAIIVLDGTLPPDFDCSINCEFMTTMVGLLHPNDYSAAYSGTELELDAQGRVYAARRSRIYRFSPSYIAEDGWAYPGAFEGWLGRCDTDLAPGDQAVCDVTNQRSLGFSCTDAICQGLTNGSQPGQFSFTPTGLDIAPDGTLYVADGGNERIQRFTTDGFFAGQAKSTGSGTGFVIGDFGKPQNVSVNSSHFYILDPSTNLLHISLLTPFVEIGHDYADLIYQSNNQFACENSADCIDRFSFRVSDGVRDPDTGQPEVSEPADVQVEVSRNFRPPFATPGISVVVMEDTPTPVPLDGSDPDPLDVLSFEIVDPPAKGTVLIDGQDVTFFPDPDAWGPDAFSFRVSDGVFTSSPETVNVEIIEINDPPIISVPDEAILGGTGFRTKLRLAFRDPDPDESHTVVIDWGDGTVEPEGTYDADGNPTGPILSHGGTDSGRITADHVFLAPGNQSVEVCVTDRMQPGPGGTKIPTPGLSLTACELIPVTIVDGIDLALSAEASTDVALPGQSIIYDFQVENRLPEAGAGVTATGIELVIRLASGFDPSNITTPLGCSRDGFRLACSVGNLAPGQSETFSMALQVAADTPSGRLLVSEARAELDQPTIHSFLSMVLHTPVSRPADFHVGAVGDALKDKPAANPGDGICASVDGVCTLRAAVEEAAASGTPKVIALANGLYLLDQDLDLSGDVMLIGNGPEQTRIHGLLQYVGGTGLGLENLTISGGGLNDISSGPLNIRRVRFTGNSTEGTFGGALQTRSTALDIRDTTFDNNSTDIDGGSLLCNFCSGVMENVTVTGGSGGGLLFIGTGHVDLKHVTIVNNNGGAWYSLPAGGSLHVYNNMTVTLANSVLADNHRLLDPYDREAVNCAVGPDASLVSLGNNALGDLAGCNLTPLASDILINNARLLPLAAGLDGLPVRKPRADSPLVDAFNDASCLDTDARGFSRPRDGNDDGIAWCDIGAVERRSDWVFRDRFRF